jgi:predicted enzyme related to lactoylglutathione lyase
MPAAESTSKLKLSFDAVFYYTNDIQKSIAFYRDVLGFPLKSRDYVARFDVDGVLFELVPAPRGQTISGPGNARLSLGVTDIQAAVAHLASKGVKATPPKQEVGGILSLFHDPDGNELCLWQTT